MGFGGTNHSWAKVHWELAKAAKQNNHEVDFFSTDGKDLIPEDLQSNLIGWRKGSTTIVRPMQTNYDMQISYTAPINWKDYLSNGKVNRMGIWCYEFPYIPFSFAKNHVYTDKILAPSKFARDGFLTAGVPADKVTVIPHGVNSLTDQQKELVVPYSVKSKKRFKILLLIGQPHLRKGIVESFEAYMKAFTNKDDVVLLAKIQLSNKPQGHEIDVVKELNKLKIKYPNHAEIELITSFIPDIDGLFKVADCCFSMTRCEAFWMPGLECQQWGCVPVVGAYGGQLDFLDATNSILLPGKEVKADLQAQYWSPDIRNGWFKTDMEAAVLALRNLYHDPFIKKMLSEGMSATTSKYTWINAFKQIEGLCG